MTTADRSEYAPEQSYSTLTRGETLRMTRELKGMTQAELAHTSGVSQAAISSIENERIDIGLDRAEKLARALGVHPAVLAFPNWRAGAPPVVRRARGSAAVTRGRRIPPPKVAPKRPLARKTAGRERPSAR